MKSHSWVGTLGLFTLIALTSTTADSQAINAQRARSPTTAPEFEVATVKQEQLDTMAMLELRVYPGGRLIIHGFNLKALIDVAFDLPGWQTIGGEKWIDTIPFDIEGKPPVDPQNIALGGEYSNAGIQNEQVRLMLQSLLIERFHLKFHMESYAGPVGSLRRGEGPLRVRAVAVNLYTKSEVDGVATTDAYPTGDTGLASGAALGFHQTSMIQLARLISMIQRIPIKDETGLPGFFNFKSKTIVTDDDFKAGSPMHLFVEALPEMGLKLVKTQGVVEKFVIDQAELPSSN